MSTGNSSPSKVPQTIAEVRLPQRIRAAGGANLKETGEYFGWEAGRVTKDVGDFTKDDLLVRGWTKERLLDVADAYEQIARITPSNPSAAGRAAQLRALAKLHD